MVMSLITSITVPHFMPQADFATVTIVQVGITTFAWLLTAFIGPQTDRATLISFYKKVKAPGPGWKAIREEAGISAAEVAHENRIGAAFLGWTSGCAVIWSSLFAIGNFLYSVGNPSRLRVAWILTVVLAISDFFLLRVTRQLWADSDASQARADTLAKDG